MDALEAEGRYRLEPVERLDAEKIYERRWAMTLLEQALNRVREEATAACKIKLFEALESLIAGETDISCGEVAVKLGLTESAVKSSLHRLRERYRASVREEIAHTVAEPAEVEAEVRYLITVVSQ